MVKKVLISGASIAGPTAALVLARHGVEVTVVEKSEALRGGGYPIDIRGSALEVVDRLGLLSRLQHSHIDMRRMNFIDATGKQIGPINPEEITGGVRGRDIEIPRGELAAALYDATKEIVSYRFNDSVSTLEERGDAIRVRFESGDEDNYDVVIGADGLHSNIRALAFGSEDQFERYIGYCFAGFSMPNPDQMGHECHIYNAPGKMAAIYAPRQSAPLIGLMVFQYPESPFKRRVTEAEQRELTARMFADDAGTVPALLGAMQSADDFYFDAVSQIRMPSWSKGRVALAGDAAHATSFLSGQGSSVALVSGYVLASELVACGDHAAAFTAHERIARGFIEANQDLVEAGRATMIPATAEDIETRNTAIAAAAANPGEKGELSGDRGRVYSAISLPEYC